MDMDQRSLLIAATAACGMVMVIGAFVLLYRGAIKLEPPSNPQATELELFKILKLAEDAPEAEHQRDERERRPCPPESGSTRTADGRFNGRRTLRPNKLANLVDDLTLRARADQESGHRHENDEPGGQGEDRVVRKGSAQPLGSVLIPIAERGLEQ